MRFEARRLIVSVIVVTACLTSAWTASAHDALSGQIEASSRAIAERPDDATLYLRRGELYRLGQEWRLARADYDFAAQLDPDLPEVDLCRGALDLDRGAASRALESLDRFLSRIPDDPKGLRLRARALTTLGRNAAAAADLDRAIARSMAPSPEDYLERARLVTSLGPDHTLDALRGLEAGIAKLGPVVGLEARARELRAAAGVAPPVRPATAAVPPRPSTEPTLRSTTDALRRREEIGAIPIGDRHSIATIPVPHGAVWRYHAQGLDLGTAWRATSYNDSAWPNGAATLGYGEPYITTTVPWGPNPNARYITTYFRKSFQITVPPATVQYLTLNMKYDDGFVAYLNGVEVARRALPLGVIGFATLASSHDASVFETIDIAAFAPQLVQGTNVLAVELHQQSASSVDLALDAELAYGINVTRGPYLQLATPTTVVVRWRTNVPSNGQVRYGSTLANQASFVGDTTPTTEHELTLSGLGPDRKYYYSVGTTTEILAGGDADCWIVTPPAPGTSKPTRIWVLGDSGMESTEQNAVRDAYLAWTGTRRTDFLLMLGDNAYSSGTDAEHQVGLFNPYADILQHCVLWPTRGNHEFLYAGDNNDYYDLFTMPTFGQAGGVASGTKAYYSFDYGNIHVVCLDSEGSDRTPNGPMLTWLRADLSSNRRLWTIAYWHHPPYSKGSHNSDSDSDSGGRMRDMRANAVPIMDELGVDLALTGHSHSYERSYLLDGHYGTSGTLLPAMKLDAGGGRPGPDGAYVKPTVGPAPHQGTVHAVAGSSSHIDGGSLNHPAMFTSMNVLGSMVLDINGNQLLARFLDDQGVVRDIFAIVKGGSGTTDTASQLQLDLRPTGPNPFRMQTQLTFALPEAGPVRLTVHDAAGRLVTTLVDGVRSVGRHTVDWKGTDAQGRRVASGVYFARLTYAGTSRNGKLVLSR